MKLMFQIYIDLAGGANESCECCESTVALPRSIPSAMKRMLKLMDQLVTKGQPLHVAVMHADAPDKAEAFSKRISTRFNCSELFITEFTPVMGVHTGPGLIGVAFYGDD